MNMDILVKTFIFIICFQIFDCQVIYGVLDYCEVANRTSSRMHTLSNSALAIIPTTTQTSLTIMKCIQICARHILCGAITYIAGVNGKTSKCHLFNGKFIVGDSIDQLGSVLVILFKVPCYYHKAVDGDWTAWTDPPCSVLCGGGTKTRQRTCTNPAPEYGGANCPGNPSFSLTCNTHICPTNGGWGTWDPIGYKPCDTYGNCGGALCLERFRHCDSPAPANGGQYCVGSAWDNPPC